MKLKRQIDYKDFLWNFSYSMHEKSKGRGKTLYVRAIFR